ncbi:MAG: acyl-CoA dehydratase activase-related protein, partial [Candidatus Aerophobetes bacterium]|nr:acyl-CoA dehydratase activase-related protein [Candidatus Aerophobetes bacterium]
MGIPRALYNFELYPLWDKFFSELGYEVVLSDETNDTIIHEGVEAVTADLCFPMKVAHGHILNLLKKKIDYIFIPSLIDFSHKNDGFKRSYDCPWSQSLPYFINSAIDMRKYPATKLLEPKLSFRMGLEKSLKKMGDELGENPLETKRAIKAAKDVQFQFYNNLRRRGKEVLGKLGKKRGFIIVSRPYNGNDPGLNLDLVEKMRELGMLPIPMEFLDLDTSLIIEDYPDIYWEYGQRILAAAQKIKQMNNLYPIYLTNFACGPDSFISKYFNEEMDRPYLELQIDEHSAEAGVITRLEAFGDTVKNWKGKKTEKKIPIKKKLKLSSSTDYNDRVIYIPYADDQSYALESSLEAVGQKAKVMEVSDQKSLQEGQKVTTGRECYPCVLTTGDIIKLIKSDGFDPEKAAFFMGAAQGPCRFGQYLRFQEHLMKRLGYQNIPFLSLDSENSYGGYGLKFSILAWEGIVAIDILRNTQRLIRPDEVNKGETNRVYLKYRDKVRETIRRGKGVSSIMKEAASS